MLSILVSFVVSLLLFCYTNFLVNLMLSEGIVARYLPQHISTVTSLDHMLNSNHYTVCLLQIYVCCTVWHYCRGSDARKLEHVQERGLRAVFCDWNTPYKQLLDWAGLPTLTNRRLQEMAIIMYKVKFKLAPMYIQDLFSINLTSYNLRVKEFSIPRFNSITYGKHSLRYLGLRFPAILDSHLHLKFSRRLLGDWIWGRWWMMRVVRAARCAVHDQGGRILLNFIV